MEFNNLGSHATIADYFNATSVMPPSPVLNFTIFNKTSIKAGYKIFYLDEVRMMTKNSLFVLNCLKGCIATNPLNEKNLHPDVYLHNDITYIKLYSNKTLYFRAYKLEIRKIVTTNVFGYMTNNSSALSALVSCNYDQRAFMISNTFNITK